MRLAEYHVHFWHNPPRQTVCTLHHGDCPPLWNRTALPRCSKIGAVEGIARCSVRDRFVRATGRKIALARAMKAQGIPRVERRVLWAVYFGRINGAR